MLPKSLAYEDNTGSLLTKNVYQPDLYGLSGVISRVFSSAGDSNTMYFLDSYISDTSQAKVIVTLELRSEAGTVSIRPVFKLPSALEAGWFHFSGHRDWFALIRVSD